MYFTIKKITEQVGAIPKPALVSEHLQDHLPDSKFSKQVPCSLHGICVKLVLCRDNPTAGDSGMPIPVW